MPTPYALLSASIITPNELTNFLQKEDGVIEEAQNLTGRISRANKHVWVYLEPDGMNDFEADQIALIEEKLGAPAKTCIVLDVSATEGSERLAIEFAHNFVHKWPSVLDNLMGKIYTADELSEVYKAGDNLLS